MTQRVKFSKELLQMDGPAEIERITSSLFQTVAKQFKKRGVVVAVSGGIDSSVVAALCVKAFGKEKVLALLMPEKDSSPDTLELSQLIVDHLQIKSVHQDITSILQAVGCYQQRDDAIKSIIPEYTSDYKCKIALPSVIEDDRYRIFSVVVQSPSGNEIKARLTPKAYLQIVAATNFKQRVRKMLEYFHADRLNYAVTGTPNRQEYDQGFFVKLGDGSADVKPIAHLYKTQVYQLAGELGIPEDIRNRPPTTDTYSMPQSQTEFYFSVPYEQMDLCLYAKNLGVTAPEAAPVIGLSPEQVDRVYRDIENKRNMAKYLHAEPILIENV